MTINTQKLREALELIEYELPASYNNAKPVCCGHGYGECCGNPEPGWDAADQKIMDVLGSVQRALSDAVSQADAQAAEIARLRDALERIISLDGQEDNEWDAVERLIPEMMSIARAALLGENNAEG